VRRGLRAPSARMLPDPRVGVEGAPKREANSPGGGVTYRLGGVSTPCPYWSPARVDRYNGDSGLITDGPVVQAQYKPFL
jgi:hypothetical protein